jgi:hypothetical protein
MKDKGFGGSGAGGWGEPPVFCGFFGELSPNPLSRRLLVMRQNVTTNTLNVEIFCKIEIIFEPNLGFNLL